MSKEQVYSLCVLLHRVLVLLDDWLCDHPPAAPMNRRPKGKYAEEVDYGYQG